MGNNNSTTTSTKEPSNINMKHSNIATMMHDSCRSILQNYVLFWLDTNIDDSSDNIERSLADLRHAVTTIKMFTDTEICMQEIKQTDVEKIFMIISSDLCQKVVPAIESWPQIDSVYIFCNNRPFHEMRIKNYSVVKGVYNDIKSICGSLQIDCERCDQDMISITFHGIDPLFNYTQIVKEALLQIEDKDSSAIKELTKYCRSQSNIPEDELQLIEQQYHLHPPIWWYTAPVFLCSTLNRALRIFDIEIIMHVGFFIRQLHRQIELLHQEQQSLWNANETQRKTHIEVFRGQGLLKQDFEKLKQAKGGLMSFNNFLTTSYDREIALQHFARPAAVKNGFVGILFIMNVDLQLCIKSKIPFVEVSGELAYFDDEETEILFTTNTTFRIDKIESIPEPHSNRLFQVNLTLVSPNNYEDNVVQENLQKEFSHVTGLSRLGLVLRRVGKLEQAVRLYNVLVDKATSTNDKSQLHYQLGRIHEERQDYSKALSHYERCIEMKQKSLPANHLDIAMCYENIGLLHEKTNNFSLAHEYLTKALEIFQKSIPPGDQRIQKLTNTIERLKMKL